MEKTTTCKRCGAKNVHWRPSANTRTGVQLHESDGKPHVCNYVYSDFNELLAHFLNNVVIKDSDSIDTIQKKKLLQDKLRWIPTVQERAQMAENVMKYKSWYK